VRINLRMSSSAQMFSAVLLAAGQSRRMGTDKALLPAGDGRALWERQIAVLKQAGAGEIFISARAEQVWVPTTISVVRDAVLEAGPLAGIVAALERSTHSHLAVLAVDLPAMQAEWFEKLLQRFEAKMGAVGKNTQEHGGYFEPLAAVYPREILPLAKAALVAGDLSLQRLIMTAVARGLMAVHEISAKELPWFTNWNEPAVGRA
jgi:molybdopterin-guanine dinucleotide biosynthesis protein A